VYNADRCSQALYIPTEHVSESIAAAPTSPRRTLTLDTILKALSWIGEIQVMPFGGLEPGARRDERSSRDY
jgi:hypothetical protein